MGDLNRKTIIFIVVLHLFLVISPIGSSARYLGQELEWKVKEGDTQTYSVKKSFFATDSDEDGDNNSFTFVTSGEDGKLVEITLKAGSTLKVEIVTLTNSTFNSSTLNIPMFGNATIKITYNDGFTTNNSADVLFFIPNLFVIKTVDNKSYWEDQVETTNISIEGDLIVVFEEWTILRSSVESTIKWNWRTGWLDFFSFKMYTEEELRIEFEFSTSPYRGTTQETTPTMITTGWDVLLLLLGFITIIPLRRRWRTPSNE